jgi:hypothetical protein
MGKQRSSFAKLQRDRAKAAKKAEKQAAREAEKEGGAVDVVEERPALVEGSTIEQMLAGREQLSAPELLEMIEKIHQLRDDGDITEEDFEDAKVELFARLPMD